MRRDHSVLSREIRRNGGDRNKYRADVAQRLWEKRKHQRHKGKLDKHTELRIWVEERLREDWSPEQIAGRLKKQPPSGLKHLSVSHKTIYYWIYEKSKDHFQLYKHLQTHRLKRKKQGKRKQRKIAIPGRISIHERPLIVNEKERYGDWESDTVEFVRRQKNPYLSVQYERKSQLVRLHKMERKTAEETKQALAKTGESVHPDLWQTISFDNGTGGRDKTS